MGAGRKGAGAFFRLRSGGWRKGSGCPGGLRWCGVDVGSRQGCSGGLYRCWRARHCSTHCCIRWSTRTITNTPGVGPRWWVPGWYMPRSRCLSWWRRSECCAARWPSTGPMSGCCPSDGVPRGRFSCRRCLRSVRRYSSTLGFISCRGVGIEYTRKEPWRLFPLVSGETTSLVDLRCSHQTRRLRV